jgi:hypothetical protein
LAAQVFDKEAFSAFDRGQRLAILMAARLLELHKHHEAAELVLTLLRPRSESVEPDWKTFREYCS